MNKIGLFVALGVLATLVAMGVLLQRTPTVSGVTSLPSATATPAVEPSASQPAPAADEIKQVWMRDLGMS
jgi:hypothetical protein